MGFLFNYVVKREYLKFYNDIIKRKLCKFLIKLKLEKLTDQTLEFLKKKK